ncbi:MAG: TonB family protein [Nitrospirae bacterium]|nr:TonB family protein [Nitrospirota bacterium]
MKYAPHIGREPNFQTVVIASAVIHLVLVTLIVVPLKTRENEYKSYFVDLVGPVEAPARHTPSSAAAAKVKEEGAVASEGPGSIVGPKADMSIETAERVSNEIERIRSIAALSKLKTIKEEKKSRDIEVIKQKILGRSPGGAGKSAGAQPLAPDSYYAMIYRKIWSEWVYPDSGSSGLETVISIKIDRDGRIISQEIEKASGNALFDRSAVKAVTKAGPLPPPPYEMEIGVRFYL